VIDGKMKLALEFLFPLALASTAAFADESLTGRDIAMLLERSGKVLVDSGRGMQPAKAKMLLSAGDVIFVGKDSTAIVTFDSCAVVLEETARFSLPKSAPCADGEMSFLQHGTMVKPVAQSACTGTGSCDFGAQPIRQTVALGQAPAGGGVAPVLVAGGYVAGVTLSAVASMVFDTETPVSGQTP
jgi:hypothetical protein